VFKAERGRKNQVLFKKKPVAYTCFWKRKGEQILCRGRARGKKKQATGIKKDQGGDTTGGRRGGKPGDAGVTRGKEGRIEGDLSTTHG